MVTIPQASQKWNAKLQVSNWCFVPVSSLSLRAEINVIIAFYCDISLKIYYQRLNMHSEQSEVSVACYPIHVFWLSNDIEHTFSEHNIQILNEKQINWYNDNTCIPVQ